jgi:hypothetical protein
MEKNYSENGNENCTETSKTTEIVLNNKKPHIILNQYGYVSARISFEDSLGLFIKNGTD